MTGATRHYVLAAGGTGGHLIPAFALAVELERRGHHVALITDERGYRRELTHLKQKIKQRSKRLWQYRRVGYDRDYAHAFEELERIRALCERAGAQYVLVHMPEHPARFANRNGPLLREGYFRRLKDWASNHEVPLLDVTARDPAVFDKDVYFSDYHHYSEVGSRRFSTLLAHAFAELVRDAQ